MTSLNRDEFELLCLSFSQAWEEETQSCQRDPSKGGRKPILTKHEDRLLFILFYLKTYPLQEVLAHLFGMSQGQAHFLIYQLSQILRETLKRMDHLPARISEEMVRKLAEEEPQDFAIEMCIRDRRNPAAPSLRLAMPVVLFRLALRANSTLRADPCPAFHPRRCETE